MSKSQEALENMAKFHTKQYVLPQEVSMPQHILFVLDYYTPHRG